MQTAWIGKRRSPTSVVSAAVELLPHLRLLSLVQSSLPSTPTPMYDMVLLKTHLGHLRGVKENAKHATDGLLTEMRPGGIALIQVTAQSSPTATPKITHAMTYLGCYPDRDGESRRIWNHEWRYIIQGMNLFELRRPFDIRRAKVSKKNYGQGAIRFVYVLPEDAAAIRAGGWLEPRPTKPPISPPSL